MNLNQVYLILVIFVTSSSSETNKDLRVVVLSRDSDNCDILQSEDNDKLVVHYNGTLVNGTLFDSSVRRGEPFSFVLGKGQVIPGWDQGMKKMCKGEIRRLEVPSHLAYGEQGVGDVIPPDATLIFQVELLELPDKEKKFADIIEKRKMEMIAHEKRIKEQEEDRLQQLKIQQAQRERQILHSERSRQNSLNRDTDEKFIQSETEQEKVFSPPDINKIPSAGETELQIQTLVTPSSCEKKAEAGDMVTVHYAGYLTNSLKFDSSVDRNQPFTFKLGSGQVIPGWEYGILGMCPGERRRLEIPPNLAYGDRGVRDIIPPKSTLIFDVQLLDIE